MPFETTNIDRAIVMTQFNLRGFWDPCGFRHLGKPSPKMLDAITSNLLAFAAGYGEGRTPTHELPRFMEGSHDEYLRMCVVLASTCEASQREAIQLIIQEIFKQSEELKADVAFGKREPSPYLRPLEKSNPWGRVILALCEAFGVQLETPTTS